MQLGALVVATGCDALPAGMMAGALIAAVQTRDGAMGRHCGSAALRSFSGRATLRAELRRGLAQLRRVQALRHRQPLRTARHDLRAWQVKRRERTR